MRISFNFSHLHTNHCNVLKNGKILPLNDLRLLLYRYRSTFKSSIALRRLCRIEYYSEQIILRKTTTRDFIFFRDFCWYFIWSTLTISLINMSFIYNFTHCCRTQNKLNLFLHWIQAKHIYILLHFMIICCCCCVHVYKISLMGNEW